MRSEEQSQARRHLRAGLYALGTTVVVLLSDRSIVQGDVRTGYLVTALAFLLAFVFWSIAFHVTRRLWASRDDEDQTD